MEYFNKEILTLDELFSRGISRKGWQGKLWDSANIDRERYYGLKQKYVDVPTMIANYTHKLIRHVVELEKGLQYWVGLDGITELTEDVLKAIPKKVIIIHPISHVFYILKNALDVHEVYEKELARSESDKNLTYREMIEKIDVLNIMFCRVYREFWSAMDSVVMELQKYYQSPLTIEEAVGKISKKWIINYNKSFHDFIESISREEKLIILAYNFDAIMSNDNLENLYSSDMYKHIKFISETLSKYKDEEFDDVVDLFKEIDEIFKGRWDCLNDEEYKETILYIHNQYKSVRHGFRCSMQQVVMDLQLKEMQQELTKK